MKTNKMIYTLALTTFLSASFNAYAIVPFDVPPPPSDEPLLLNPEPTNPNSPGAYGSRILLPSPGISIPSNGVAGEGTVRSTDAPYSTFVQPEGLPPLSSSPLPMPRPCTVAQKQALQNDVKSKEAIYNIAKTRLDIALGIMKTTARRVKPKDTVGWEKSLNEATEDANNKLLALEKAQLALQGCI